MSRVYSVDATDADLDAQNTLMFQSWRSGTQRGQLSDAVSLA